LVCSRGTANRRAGHARAVGYRDGNVPPGAEL